MRNRTLSNAKEHLPQAGTVIASSFTSPLDPLYLAGIFCPIFTRSYPGYKKVEQISLFGAISLAMAAPKLAPSNPDKLVTLQELKKKNPNSIICVFPECTTTNGRGILPFSPSLLTADAKTKIFPVSLRYTPVDVVTPIPGSYLSFIWTLLSKPTHCIRVRIAECVQRGASAFDTPPARSTRKSTFETNVLDALEEDSNQVTAADRALLDQVGESLARLGRVKRVGLGVQEKIDFVKMWSRMRKSW